MGAWCREPEFNERDILMAFHLFMHGKWRGTVTLWNSWQNKEPTLGKWLYLWFRADRWRYQEGGKSDAFVTVQSVKWCDVWQHTLVLTLSMSASGVKTWEVICSCLSAVLILVLDMHMMDQDINPCSGIVFWVFFFLFLGFTCFLGFGQRQRKGRASVASLQPCLQQHHLAAAWPQWAHTVQWLMHIWGQSFAC